MTTSSPADEPDEDDDDEEKDVDEDDDDEEDVSACLSFSTREEPEPAATDWCFASQLNNSSTKGFGPGGQANKQTMMRF